MPAQTTDQEPRLTLMNFRATAAEREQVQRFAAEQGTTVSGLLRRGLELQGFKTRR